MTSYSYSLDREHWLGRFDSRSDALQAATAHGMREATPPEVVFVGQRIEPDCRTFGHARKLIEIIQRRVREDNGELADGFLKRLSDEQVGDLDHALQQTLHEWMRRHALEPSWVRVEAVGEYPMPVAIGASSGERNGEVHDIGIADGQTP